MKMLLLLYTIFLIFPSEQPLRTQVENYLKEQLKNCEKFEFEIISSPVLKAAEKINIDTERQLRLSGNLGYIPVKILSGRSNSSQSLVSVRVKLYRKVLVAKNPIRYGTELKEIDFQPVLSDVAQLRGTPVTDIFEVNATKARLSIRQGDILTKEALQPLPLVKSGEKVLAVFSNGSVIITMDAIAKQDGAKGDLIRIMTSDKKLFRAKIIDENSVKIQE